MPAPRSSRRSLAAKSGKAQRAKASPKARAKLPARTSSHSSTSFPSKMKRLFTFIFKTILGVLALFLVTSFLAVLAYKWLPVYYTPLMAIRQVQGVEARAGGWQHRWVPLDSISPYLPVAAIAAEDQNFLKHKGFDYRAILDAYEEAQEGGRVRGASTISQQTAKNVFLWPHSSWVRKGFEAYFTVLIEWMWSKQRIMEVYLNSIEMGPGIYGAEAVAQEYFGCSARALSRAQCALIVATLPNPLKYSSKHPSQYMRKRQRWIEVQMRAIPFLPAEEEPSKKPSDS